MKTHWFDHKKYKPLSAPVMDHDLIKRHERLAFFHDPNTSPKFIWLKPDETMSNPTEQVWIIGVVAKD